MGGLSFDLTSRWSLLRPFIRVVMGRCLGYGNDVSKQKEKKKGWEVFFHPENAPPCEDEHVELRPFVTVLAADG